MATPKKDMSQLVKTLQTPSYGCTVTKTRNGHWKVAKPGRPPVFMSSTPSDRRALDNAKADVRRYLDLDV